MLKNTKITAIILSLLLGYSASEEWKFPDDFQFGTATSAYQVEGGWNADGKGVSVWDYLTNGNSFTVDGSNGSIACDSYHKWKEDVKILKDLGVNYYRFSLSWTRILPQGFSSIINPKGLEYYNNLIDELKANGIEPVVTLFHWDSPQIFSSIGNYYSSYFPNLFANYARVAFRNFGDRVKTWITFNEPKVVCQDYNEYIGTINKVHPNGVIEYLCTYNLLKAHAEAYRVYKNEFKSGNGRIGITLNFEWSEPASDSSEDIAAAEQRRQFEFGLYANPIVYGNYPKIVINRIANRSKLEGFPDSRLPKLTSSDQRNVKGTFDFIGLNHYNSWLVEHTDDKPIGMPSYGNDMGTKRYLDPSWKDTEWNGKVVPWGLQHTLKWLKITYRNPKIIITECGYPDQTGTLQDSRRISFLQQYLNATLTALIIDQVKVEGFTVWSLMDNFEWAQGYTIKFGLYNVDFADPDRTRTAKNSATYFKSVITSRYV